MGYMLTMGINPSYPLGPSIREEPYARGGFKVLSNREFTQSIFFLELVSWL